MRNRIAGPRTIRTALLSGSLGAALLFAACGEDDASVASDGSTVSAGANGEPRNGAGASTGASISVATAGEGSGASSSSGARGLEKGESCAGETETAQQVPLAMILMLDKSLSMNLPVEVGATTTKWDAIVEAIGDFVEADESVGIRVGLQFFPSNRPCEADGECGGGSHCHKHLCSESQEVCHPVLDPCPGSQSCERISIEGSTTFIGAEELLTRSVCVVPDTCDADSYSALAVPVTELPGASATLVAELSMHGPTPLPFGETPTGPALTGAVEAAQRFERDNPGVEAIVVLATDGNPQGCSPELPSAVAAIAAAGLGADPSVPTYAIGVFSPEDEEGPENVELIARQGGGQAFVVEAGADVGVQFAAALNEVRGVALRCDYEVPQPAAGDELDYGLVNVELTSAGGTETIPYVGSAAGCDADQGGWHYDVDPADGAPRRIVSCPSTCLELRSVTEGTVDIRLGCKTVGAPVVR